MSWYRWTEPRIILKALKNKLDAFWKLIQSRSCLIYHFITWSFISTHAIIMVLRHCTFLQAFGIVSKGLAGTHSYTCRIFTLSFFKVSLSVRGTYKATTYYPQTWLSWKTTINSPLAMPRSQARFLRINDRLVTLTVFRSLMRICSSLM